jgi:hypothetical protein
VASAVKYNAFAATLPLIVLLFESTPGKRWLVRHALAAATWLGVTLGAMGINAVLVDQPMHFWYSTLAVYDIAGVINYEDTLGDEQLRRELAGTGLRVEHNIQEHARAIYATRNMLRLVVGKQRMWNLPTSGRVPAPEPQRDAVGNAWRRMVTEHPAAYLYYRAAFFLSVTGVTYGSFGAVPPRLVTYAGMVDRLGIPQTTFAYQEQWSRFYRWLSVETPLFRPWLYIVVAILLLPLCRRNRDIAAVLASGLVVEASLFFIAPSADYRYSHWTIASTCIASILLVARITSLRNSSSITPTFAIENAGTR